MITCYAVYGLEDPVYISDNPEDGRFFITNEIGSVIVTDVATLCKWDYADEATLDIPQEINECLNTYPVVIRIFVNIPGILPFMGVEDFRYLGDKLLNDQYEVECVQYQNNEHTSAIITLTIDE